MIFLKKTAAGSLYIEQNTIPSTINDMPNNFFLEIFSFKKKKLKIVTNICPMDCQTGERESGSLRRDMTEQIVERKNMK